METRQQRIQNLLQQRLAPTILEVHNESANHHVPKGSETHFKVMLVSIHFQDLSRVARQRLLHQVLKEELQNGLHALTAELKTPAEWETGTQRTRPSPHCKDGFDK